MAEIKKEGLTKKTEKLQLLSSGSKIGVELMWLTVLVILPLIFPSIIELRYRASLTINIILAFFTSLFYEILRFYFRKKGKDESSILKFQLLTSVILLTWFLHVFGRINGPFFSLYLLTIMESALNLTPSFVIFIVGAMVAATVTEFSLLVYHQEIVFNLYTLLQLFIRLVSLLFMGSYGLSMVKRIFSEELAKKRAQEAAEKLEKTTHELTKANTKLQELSVLKDEFVSVASHELRGPMTTIKGYISMILEGDAGKLPKKAVEFLNDAYESNDRMIRLVNNMLNVSRIESGRLIINLKDIRIEEAIEEIVKTYKLEADTHGLELKYISAREPLPKVRVDPDRIREVISNLVGNAINFTSHGYIHIRAKAEDGMVVVSVEDSGVGIAEADQKQLFRKFSQVGVGAPLRKGSGLGLYICKMLINEFGGKIWLKSKVGKGTTFYFSLPAIENHNHDTKEIK